MAKNNVSLIIPVLDEQESIGELYTWIKKVLKTENLKGELIFIDDGSTDDSWKEISKLATGVTACQELITAAAGVGADALLVHHGYFWRGEDQSISGIKKTRIEALLKHN